MSSKHSHIGLSESLERWRFYGMVACDAAAIAYLQGTRHITPAALYKNRHLAKSTSEEDVNVSNTQ